MTEPNPKSPVADVELKKVSQNGVEFYACPETGGLFLHHGDLNALLPNHHQGLLNKEDLELSSIVTKATSDDHGPVSCIYCGNPKMTKVNFLGLSDIVLDACEKCGSFWVDGGELEKIRSYWSEVEEGSKKSHDPLVQTILNFLKSLALPFFAFVLSFGFLNELHAQDALAQLRSRVGGMYGSFSANFTVSGSSGQVSSGKIYYQAPNKVHLKMGNGGIVATNGRYIYIYNPASGMAAKQDAGGSSGGILGLLQGYEGQVRGNTFIFKKPGTSRQVTVTVANNFVRTVQIRYEDGGTTTYSFSGVQQRGVPASLFSFKPPPSVQVVENPLNQ